MKDDHYSQENFNQIQSVSVYICFPYFLRMLELPPKAVVHPPGDLLWTAHHSLDVDFKTAV